MPVIKAYSWHATRRPIPGIFTTSWVNPMDTRGTAEFIAERAVTQLSPYKPDERALLVWFPAGYTYDVHVTRHTVREFLLQRVDTSRTRSWYLQLYSTLKKRGIEPAAVIMDEESNVTNWAFENYARDDKALPAYLHQVWADADVQMAMPDELRRFTIDMILKKDVDAVNAFNQWTMSLVCKMLRELVLETYVQVFGKVPIVSNWENFRGAFQTYDINGWPNLSVQVGDWSSPAIYVGMWGNRHNPAMSGRKKDPYWNRFLDCVNFVRSTMAFNGRCVPWVAYQSAVEPRGEAPKPVQWLWKQILLHAAATGVERLIYWNPKHATGATDEEDATLGEFIARVKDWPKVQLKLPEIQLDADEVTTGDITTRYSDYISGRALDLSFKTLQ